MILLSLLLFTSQIADETYIPRVACPAVIKFFDVLNPQEDNARAACDVEIQLRNAGWRDPMVVSALANAWHESKWNPSAVGDRGNSIGFWQLNKNGLGRGMGNLRFNHAISTEQIIASVECQDIEENEPTSAAKIFCKKVMRPADIPLQSFIRARTASLIQ